MLRCTQLESVSRETHVQSLKETELQLELEKETEDEKLKSGPKPQPICCTTNNTHVGHRLPHEPSIICGTQSNCPGVTPPSDQSTWWPEVHQSTGLPKAGLLSVCHGKSAPPCSVCVASCCTQGCWRCDFEFPSMLANKTAAAQHAPLHLKQPHRLQVPHVAIPIMLPSLQAWSIRYCFSL